MTFALVAYYLIVGEPHREVLAAGLTYQECKTDLAALDHYRYIRLACEAEI